MQSAHQYEHDAPSHLSCRGSDIALWTELPLGTRFRAKSLESNAPIAQRAATHDLQNLLDADDFDLKLTRSRTEQTPEEAKADINAMMDAIRFDTLMVKESTLEEAIDQLQEQVEGLQFTV